MNVLLHAASAALVWVLLAQLRVPGAVLAAFLFALHPVHVESVAWITERKNVLSGVLFLAAAWSYLRFAPPDEGEPRRGPRRFYFLSGALFLLALLAKTVTAVLPAALLVAIGWRRGRLGRRDVAPLVPFFALGALAGLGTLWIERNMLGAQGEEFALSPIDRVVLSGRALAFYLSKLALPSPLSFVYPKWEIDAGEIGQWIYPIAAVAAFAALFLARRRIGRGPLAAMLYFAVALVPALGFFDVYPFRFSYVADHFQYLASIGPLALAAAAASVAVRRLGDRTARLALFYASLVLLVLAALTWRRAEAFHDAETLWRDTIAKNDSAWMAHLNLGQLLAASGRGEEALREYEAALRYRPDSDKAHNNIGLAAAAAGRYEEAVRHYREAIRLNPRSTSARGNLGLALLSLGRTEEAIEALAEAIEIRPRAPELRTNLGIALLRRPDPAGAERAFREAIRLAPGDAENRYRLGVLLLGAGRKDEAAESLREALRLDPGHRNARAALEGSAAVP
ncbi:MAG: tetratricopeptide repeat protein [Candidatus Latescibacterota bacterium]|nr:MAG: tetratricopeptide repeat protein [Candidatus Latescibacterota bacterium]